MGLFLEFKSGSVKTLRFFERNEREYTSKISGTARYARRVIDREGGTVNVWTYGYPVRRALEAALKAARLDIIDADIKVSAFGAGVERRYKVEALAESNLSVEDERLIDSCRISLDKVCK